MPRERAQYRYAGENFLTHFGLSVFTSSNPITVSYTCTMTVTQNGSTVIPERGVTDQNSDNTAFLVKIGASETENWKGNYTLEMCIKNATADTNETERINLVFEE